MEDVIEVGVVFGVGDFSKGILPEGFSEDELAGEEVLEV